MLDFCSASYAKNVYVYFALVEQLGLNIVFRVDGKDCRRNKLQCQPVFIFSG